MNRRSYDDAPIKSHGLLQKTGHFWRTLGLRIFLINLLASPLYQGCSSDDLESGETVDPNGVESTVTPLINSNTNWLLSCSADSDCGEGEQCDCGSCVIPCSPVSPEASRCATDMDHAEPELVECAEADPVSEVSSCGEDYSRAPAGICLLMCEMNDDCPDHLLCHRGRCVRPRRGESRGCDDALACVEAGGSPERCRVLCEEELEGGMSVEREPAPPMREFLECERRCVAEGYPPEACRSRCAVCGERCLLIENPREARECQMRCQRLGEGDEASPPSE